jgi:WD40 repeat protein
MVELSTTKKRKRISSTKPTSDKASRYPPSFHFSALTYKQSPKALSISPQTVLASVPTQPNPIQFNIISGDLFSLNAPPHKTPNKAIENYHKQHTITHLEWNQKGNTLASIDETGKLALWSVQVRITKKDFRINI